MKLFKEHAAVKSIGGIVLLLMVFAAIVSYIGYDGYTTSLLSQYSEGAFLTAKAAAELLDIDRMDAYAESEGSTKEYVAVWTRLDKLCNSTGSTFIYVIQPDLTDYAHITFLFSTINHNSPYTIYEFGFVRDTTNDDYRQKYRKLYEQESDQELVIRDKGYIETDPHITAMISLKDSEGRVRGILCVQRQMEYLSAARRNYLKNVLTVLIVAAILVLIGQSFFLHRTLLHPLQVIEEEAARFSKENVLRDTKLKDVISNRDEIGRLAGSIDRMEEQIDSYIKNLTQITAEKERISTELELATRIQADMLPNIYPAFPDRNEFDIYASMDPAKEVGGDFYDYFLVDDDHLCMVIADVSGKGVPAALFMMASKIILANNAMTGKSPAKILTDTNAAICSNNREEMFVTVWLGILELSTGKLTASNAGHEYPVIRQPDGSFTLFKDRHGLVIGAMDGARYREYSLQLEPGAKLFVYTDGVAEATNAQNELFGTDRMLEALNDAPEASPEQVLTNVRRAVDGFVREAEQFDDLTMLCLEYRGSTDENTKRFELSIPAEVEKLPTLLSFIEEHLEQAGASHKVQMQVAVAAEEIFVNIAQYAYAPASGVATVQLELTAEPAAMTLRFMDRGTPFDPLAKPDPDVTLSAEERSIGGLGIYMTKKTMDEVSYQYKDSKNILTLVKKL